MLDNAVMCHCVTLLLTSISLLRSLTVSQKPVLGKIRFKLHRQCEEAGQAGSQTLVLSFRRVSTAGMCLTTLAFEPGC